MSERLKVIFITGASSGIGLSTAVYLTSLGYQVVGTSRNPQKLTTDLLKTRYRREHTKYKFANKSKTRVKAVKSLIPEQIELNLTEIIERIKFYPLILTERRSIEMAVHSAWEEFDGQNGGIDVLINNAGSGYYGGIEELSMDLIKDQFDINYFGQIRVLKEMLPLMRPVGGQIINIASLAGILAIPFQPQYSATKAAVLRMTESLRNELKSFNIKVSAVLPGDINTSFNTESIRLHDQNKNYKSIDIDEMLEALPVLKDSPYYKDNLRVWREVMLSLITAPCPLEVAKKIAKAIDARRPKSRYYVGSALEIFLMKYIIRIFPHDLAVKLMGKFFGL